MLFFTLAQIFHFFYDGKHNGHDNSWNGLIYKTQQWNVTFSEILTSIIRTFNDERWIISQIIVFLFSYFWSAARQKTDDASRSSLQNGGSNSRLVGVDRTRAVRSRVSAVQWVRRSLSASGTEPGPSRAPAEPNICTRWVRPIVGEGGIQTARNCGICFRSGVFFCGLSRPGLRPCYHDNRMYFQTLFKQILVLFVWIYWRENDSFEIFIFICSLRLPTFLRVRNFLLKVTFLFLFNSSFRSVSAGGAFVFSAWSSSCRRHFVFISLQLSSTSVYCIRPEISETILSPWLQLEEAVATATTFWCSAAQRRMVLLKTDWSFQDLFLDAEQNQNPFRLKSLLIVELRSSPDWFHFFISRSGFFYLLIFSFSDRTVCSFFHHLWQIIK